ncbi:hypothetical protein Tco_0582098 [Tanacetum coccineum]
MVACCLGFDEFLSWLLVVGKRDVMTADKNDIIWLMASLGSIIEIDKVIHTVKTDMVKLVVEIESFGKRSDEIDKETVSFDEELQDYKQSGLRLRSCINGLYLHMKLVFCRE